MCVGEQRCYITSTLTAGMDTCCTNDKQKNVHTRAEGAQQQTNTPVTRCMFYLLW